MNDWVNEHTDISALLPHPRTTYCVDGKKADRKENKIIFNFSNHG